MLAPFDVTVISVITFGSGRKKHVFFLSRQRLVDAFFQTVANRYVFVSDRDGGVVYPFGVFSAHHDTLYRFRYMPEKVDIFLPLSLPPKMSTVSSSNPSQADTVADTFVALESS